jgi:hypothetical protein
MRSPDIAGHPVEGRQLSESPRDKISCVEKWACAEPRGCAEGAHGIAAAKDSDDARHGWQGTEGRLIFDDDDAANRGGRPHGTLR